MLLYKVARDCADVLAAGQVTSGVYTVRINNSYVEVYCDMGTDAGGWLVNATSWNNFKLHFILIFIRSNKATAKTDRNNKRKYRIYTTRLRIGTKLFMPVVRSTGYVLASYFVGQIYRVAQKTGPPYLIANILKIPWPNCVEIGELLQ